MPRISIVVPVKDCSKTISKSIKSVLAQTYQDFELIVVNNTCKDDTIEKVLSFEDSRINVVDCTTPGIVPALNTGLSRSSSPLIARQDGDDVWYPEKLEKQLEVFDSRSDIDICGTQIRLVSNDGQIVDDKFRYPVEDTDIKTWLLTGKNAIAHPSVMFKREILLRTGGYDDSYPIAEDHHMWLRCVKWFNFCNLGDVMVDYNSTHNPKYDPRIPLLASEAQFKLLQHMGVIEVC